MNRRTFMAGGLVACVAPLALADLSRGEMSCGGRRPKLLLDSAMPNPGDPPLVTEFSEPGFLKAWHYDAQILVGQVAGVPTYDAVAPGAISVDSDERRWAVSKLQALLDETDRAHAHGLLGFAYTDLMLFPKQVVEKFRDEICDGQGRIDISKPKTEELLRAQLQEIFAKIPGLDGLVFRTGEVYLHDFPYHTASGGVSELAQANTAILDGERSHIRLLKIIREEVCDKLNKQAVYRTWDFGGFHIKPDYYLRVVDAIPPHPKLRFSIKHQAADFLRTVPFNPTIGIGEHPQIIEVQCQEEVYGKGAHPDYIGRGVIDGWEEYAWIKGQSPYKGIRDLGSVKQFAGLWTWSRGGGWNGPFITNEFWPALNSWVVSESVRRPDRSESELFDEYAHLLGLSLVDRVKFRELCLLAEQGILRGQVTALDAKLDLWWTRDDTFDTPDLSDFVKKGLVEAALAEKAEAVRMWTRIEQISGEIEFGDPTVTKYVQTSCGYGRIKYAIIEQMWTILLRSTGIEKGPLSEAARSAIVVALKRYDDLWAEWWEFKRTHSDCASLYVDTGYGHRPGIGATLARIRSALGLEHHAAQLLNALAPSDDRLTW